MSHNYAVLCPSGEVHEPTGGSYKSFSEFLEIMNSRNAPPPSQESSIKQSVAPPSYSKLTVELQLDRTTAKAIARRHHKR